MTPPPAIRPAALGTGAVLRDAGEGPFVLPGQAADAPGHARPVPRPALLTAYVVTGLLAATFGPF